VRHAAPVPSVAGPRGRETGYDLGTDSPGSSYSWSADEQGGLGYRQVSYDDRENAWADSDLPGGGYSWMTDDPSDGINWPVAGFSTAHGNGNAIRGFAPLPDEPLPVYPPGPFAAWNRGNSDNAARNSADAGYVGTDELGTQGSSRSMIVATITPDEFDTDYSLPAIKDPVPVYRDGVASATDRPGGRAGGGSSAVARGGSAAGARDRAAAVPASGSRSERHAHSRSARAKSGRAKSKHQSVWLAIGAAVVIVAAVIVVLVTTSIGSGPTTAGNKPTSPARTTKPTSKTPAGKWEYIGSRATDPTPLSLKELFPASFYVSGIYYHVTIERQGHDCHTALIGAALQAAVRQADCTQVLRASYASRLENAMATVGVFNLTDATTASTAATHAGRVQFVTQLAAKNGVTSKIGQGTGLEEAVVKGHYLVLVWAEFINLAAPKTNWQRSHLTNFMNTLIDSTINNSLSYRMVDGKPPAPASGSS
jgi:hypothetical protein